MIKLRLMILLLIFLIIYFINIERIHFLNKKETINLFSSLNYFNHFTLNNIKSRDIPKNLSIKKYYIDNTLNFTEYDKKVIKKIINKLRKLSGNFILFREWKFSLVTYNIEKGLPHTHNDVIILSKNLVNSIDINEGIFLFIHEKTHILQREHPTLFLELYRRWNFIKVNKVGNIEKYNDSFRLNPDGIDNNLIYKFKDTYILPVAMYKRDNIDLVDCKNVGIYLELDENNYYIPDNPTIKKLSDSEEYRELFDGLNSNNYHPNELAAEYMSMYWMKKLGFVSNTENLGRKIFDDWYNINKLKLI